MKRRIRNARRRAIAFPALLLAICLGPVAGLLISGCSPSEESVRRIVQDELGKAGTREAITSAAVIGPYSPAVRAGRFLFVSGQIALDPATGAMVQETIGAETRQVLTNVMRVLRSAGYDSADVVSATVYMRDMKNYGAINEVYATFFPAHGYPARAAVEVSSLPKGANVEVAVIAWKGR